MINGTAEYRFGLDPPVCSPRFALLGATYQATYFIVKGPALVVGVGLRPAGWASLIREDAAILADRVADAALLFETAVTGMLEKLENHHSPEHIIAVLDQVMRMLFARAPDPPLWFTRLTEQWLMRSASPQVDQLVEAVGMSNRQIERMAGRIFGAPPKMLARKYRALKAASRLINTGGDWHDVAESTFSDQSHIIREFRQFVGMTPRELVNNPSPVLRMTFERRRLLSRLPPLTLIS